MDMMSFGGRLTSANRSIFIFHFWLDYSDVCHTIHFFCNNRPSQYQKSDLHHIDHRQRVVSANLVSLIFRISILHWFRVKKLFGNKRMGEAKLFSSDR